MFSNCVIVQSHVDAVVVEKENTIAAPVLQHGVNQTQRQSFIAPGINEEKGLRACSGGLHEALRINPNYAEAFYSRGRLYADKGDYSRAIHDYDQALGINPNCVDAFITRGLAYWRSGNYDQAVKDYDQALRLTPDSAEAFYNRALAYEHKGDYERAVQDFSQALRLKPSDSDAFKTACTLIGSYRNRRGNS